MKERPRQLQAGFLARIAFDAISGMIAFFALPVPRQMKDDDETTTDEEEDDPGVGRVLEGEGAAAGPWRGEGGQGRGMDDGGGAWRRIDTSRRRRGLVGLQAVVAEAVVVKAVVVKAMVAEAVVADAH